MCPLVGERVRFPLRNDYDDDFVEGTERTKTTISRRKKEREGEKECRDGKVKVLCCAIGKKSTYIRRWNRQMRIRADNNRDA